MSNPKEKAKEICLKYQNLLFICLTNEWEFISPDSKQCALIAVEEILNAVTTIADKKYDFYIEVKKEIESL